MSAHGTDRLAEIKKQAERARDEKLWPEQYDFSEVEVLWLVSEVERLRDAVAEAGELFDEIKDHGWSVRIGRLEAIAAWLHWYHQMPGGE